MASFSVIGFIDGIKYLPNGGGCLLFLSEFKKGYRKSTGEVVDDKTLSWKVIFKPSLVKYVSTHFNKGMLVEVKGEVYPYMIDKSKIVDGYSVMGQTLNLFSFPRYAQKVERRMMDESQSHMDGVPDLEGFRESDF